MKRIALTMMMLGLLSSCSTDELMVLNNENEADVVLSTDTSGTCVDAGALGASATISHATGVQVYFGWNNLIDHATDKTYVSYIELKADPGCPVPAGYPEVAATYPIDLFNTSSFIVPAVSAKCFYWRIVVNQYTGSALDCTTTTGWTPATYIQ